MIVVAVDGPAGSGKSSVSKQAARQLGFGYLDTGAGYRALTKIAIDAGIDLATVGEQNLAVLFDYSISTDPDNYWVKVGDTDLTEAIRSQEVEINVSKVNVSIWIPRMKLPDHIDAMTPELKPWHHAITGALSEGYKLNSTPTSSSEHPDFIRLVFIREFGSEFLLLPWQRLYFVQDFAFFIRAMMGARSS